MGTLFRVTWKDFLRILMPGPTQIIPKQNLAEWGQAQALLDPGCF